MCLVAQNTPTVPAVQQTGSQGNPVHFHLSKPS